MCWNEGWAAADYILCMQQARSLKLQEFQHKIDVR